ncbi:MAG: hypothetical protein ACLT1J_06470 [Mediterraneibacter gnavus]
MKPDGHRDLAFRICQLQLLADAMRKNETVLEEALKKDLGKSAFESYATEIGFVLADIRSCDSKSSRNGRLQNV